MFFYIFLVSALFSIALASIVDDYDNCVKKNTGLTWKISSAALKIVKTRHIIDTPDFSESVKLVYDLSNRPFAVAHNKIYDNPSLKTLPIGGYSWVLTTESRVSVGKIENGLEFGVKHIHIANASKIVIAGEMQKGVDGSVTVNARSGTFTAPIKKKLDALINSKIAETAIDKCLLYVFKRLDPPHIHIKNAAASLVSTTPVAVRELQEVCAENSAFRSNYGWMCDRFLPWKSEELTAANTELKIKFAELCKQTEKAHNDRLSKSRDSLPGNVRVVDIVTKSTGEPTYARLESLKNGSVMVYMKSPFYPDGIAILHGRTDSAIGVFNADSYRCSDGNTSHVHIATVRSYAYTPTRGIHEVLVTTATRPSCINSKFRELMNRINFARNAGSDALVSQLFVKYHELLRTSPSPAHTMMSLSALCPSTAGTATTSSRAAAVPPSRERRLDPATATGPAEFTATIMEGVNATTSSPTVSRAMDVKPTNVLLASQHNDSHMGNGAFSSKMHTIEVPSYLTNCRLLLDGFHEYVIMSDLI